MQEGSNLCCCRSFVPFCSQNTFENYNECGYVSCVYCRASLGAQSVKNLPKCRRSPATLETRVQSVQPLGQEDPLEKEMAAHSSILPWKSPWTRGAWQVTVYEAAKSQTRLSD